MNELKSLLRLNLQHFAEEGDGDPSGEEGTPENEDVTTEPEPTPEEKTGEEKLFTQSELDAAISKRLERERKKAEDKAEQARLEEQGEYSKLLEIEREKVAEFQRKEAERERNESIVSKLIAKGLDGEKASRYAKYVDPTAVEEADIEASVDEVYNDFAGSITYPEPTPGGRRKEPAAKSQEDYGKELFARVRG